MPSHSGKSAQTQEIDPVADRSIMQQHNTTTGGHYR